MNILGLYVGLTRTVEQLKHDLRAQRDELIGCDRAIAGLKRGLMKSERDYEQAQEELEFQKQLVKSGSIQISKFLAEQHARENR
jgi:multidrug resistance efflux pump